MNSTESPPPGSLPSAIHLLIAAALTLPGIALLAYMVTVEGEPGLLPLLLVASGVAWFLIAWVRARSARVRTR